MKKCFLILYLLVCCIFFNGCWNYQGLDTLDIVTGIAIDKEHETGMYLITYEMVDTEASGKEASNEIKYVESTGSTIFGAVRNAKKRLLNKMDFGNMKTIIISNQIAEEDGVLVLLEICLRDGEPRETTSVAISQEETAKAILTSKGMDSKIVAYEIDQIIKDDNRVTASTKNLQMYQAYNAIKEKGSSLVLPALHLQKNNEDSVAESNGIALFNGDKLIGFLPPEQTLYYLFIVDEIKGAALSLPYRSGDGEISMEIKKNKSKTSVRYENGQLFVSVKIKTTMNLSEFNTEADLSEWQERDFLESYTANFIKEGVLEVFQSVQTDYQTDIFSLGRLLYEDHPDLWRQLEGNWNEIFSQAQLDVQVTIEVLNTGVLKNY